MKFPARGLYAITQPEAKTIQQVINEVEAALKGGANIVQYRDKQPIDALTLASELLSLCHSYKVPLLINDNLSLAAQIGADGVHLGKDDGDLTLARQMLGEDAIIGISCYNDVLKAQIMADQGASYVAFGRFFSSGSKPLAAAADISSLNQAKALIKVPIVAIGGILPSNGGQLLAAGADVLAVIGGLFDHEPESAARQYLRLF